jgi:iron complex transport system permease protein
MSSLGTEQYRQQDRVGETMRTLRSMRRNERAWALVVGMVLAGVVALLLGLGVATGDLPISLSDVFPAMFGQGDDVTVLFVRDLRLPRALIGLMVGVALAMSGAVFQSMLRNPLASPDFLGITGGASLGAVLYITRGDSKYLDVSNIADDSIALPFVAFVGAVALAFLMYVLAYRNGLSMYRLVLIGIGIGAAAVAGTEYLLTRASQAENQAAYGWLAGSLSSRSWPQVGPLALALAMLVPLIVLLDRRLRILQLGDDTATGLGLRVQRNRLALLVVAVGLVAVAVASAGPIAFVALLSPAIARRLLRSPGPALVISGLTGAVLVLLADYMGQRLFETGAPVGVMTAALGAPYLLWLLVRANRIGAGG